MHQALQSQFIKKPSTFYVRMIISFIRVSCGGPGGVKCLVCVLQYGRALAIKRGIVTEASVNTSRARLLSLWGSPCLARPTGLLSSTVPATLAPVF